MEALESSVMSLCSYLNIYSLLASLLFVLFLYKIISSRLTILIWPTNIEKALKSQGIDGPPPSFFNGNLKEMRRLTMEAKKIAAAAQVGGGHQAMTQDYAKVLFPYLHQWRKTYGTIFAFWTGRRPVVFVTQPDLVREMSLRVSLGLGKPKNSLSKIQEPLFGRGIIKSNGPEWAHQRKIIAPEFFMDKVKGMVDLMVESADPLLSSWEIKIEQGGGAAEITVDKYFRNFSEDVISRACFIGAYSQGKEIFGKLRVLKRLISENRMRFELASTKFLTNLGNKEVQRTENEIRSLILQVVKERIRSSASEQDLLRSLLANAGIGQVGSKAADDFIVDNCKNIYFAGYETTAVTTTWCLMLLASHPHWQDRARAEVMEVCGGGQVPNKDTIMRMKTLSMIIQETLRLYPPTHLVARGTFEEMSIGKYRFPKGVELQVPTSMMHHDATLWGPDADEFRPDRFAHGVSGACKHPSAYFPFGFGARLCLGQNFATIELKVVISLLLSKFCFSLSPRYRHSPTFRMIIEPEFGLPLIVKKVVQ